MSRHCVFELLDQQCNELTLGHGAASMLSLTQHDGLVETKPPSGLQSGLPVQDLPWQAHVLDKTVLTGVFLSNFIKIVFSFQSILFH